MNPTHAFLWFFGGLLAVVLGFCLDGWRKKRKKNEEDSNRQAVENRFSHTEVGTAVGSSEVSSSVPAAGSVVYADEAVVGDGAASSEDDVASYVAPASVEVSSSSYGGGDSFGDSGSSCSGGGDSGGGGGD